MRNPVGLIIAGLDPSGGAGVIVDIKTFAAFNCFPTAAITTLTYQNSSKLFGATHQKPESLRAQIESIIEEYDPAVVKIGLLPTSDLVVEVSRLLCERNLPGPVVDPVWGSTSGYQLMNDAAVAALCLNLVSLARLLTPNIPEAERLTGLQINNEEKMHEAARRLREMGARAVLVKGGHLHDREGSAKLVEAVDVLDDQGQVTVFRSDWIEAPPVRGTGCMLSSAIAACMSQGMDLAAAVRRSKQFVADEIRRSTG